MNVETLSHCIICLDIGNPKNKLYPLPCHCNAFVHKECFQQLEDDCCLICHQPNKYTDPNLILKKKDTDITTDSITINFENQTIISNYFNKFCSNINNQCNRYFRCFKNMLLCCYINFTIILYFIAAYITGITMRALLWILIRLPIYDISIVSHIASCILIGIITQFVIFKCCFESSSE